MKQRCGDECSQHAGTRIAKSVADKCDNRETDPAGIALAEPVALHNGAHGSVLSKCMYIDQGGSGWYITWNCPLRCLGHL